MHRFFERWHQSYLESWSSWLSYHCDLEVNKRELCKMRRQAQAKGWCAVSLLRGNGEHVSVILQTQKILIIKLKVYARHHQNYKHLFSKKCHRKWNCKQHTEAFGTDTDTEHIQWEEGWTTCRTPTINWLLAQLFQMSESFNSHFIKIICKSSSTIWDDIEHDGVISERSMRFWATDMNTMEL